VAPRVREGDEAVSGEDVLIHVAKAGFPHQPGYGPS
jgi:hypothetical protein